MLLIEDVLASSAHNQIGNQDSQYHCHILSRSQRGKIEGLTKFTGQDGRIKHSSFIDSNHSIENLGAYSQLRKVVSRRSKPQYNALVATLG